MDPTDSESLPPVNEVPAAHLTGKALPNGWTVGERVKKDPGASGGHFSISYAVSNERGETAFLKALNFQAAATRPGSFVDKLNNFTKAFIFERDLLLDCDDRKMSRIISLLDHGEVTIEEAGPLLSEVPYLIFELADGDIRAFQARLSAFDVAWVFRVMKHVFQGLEQLHAAHAAHQDLKPSNVLTQESGNEMKLGDLGCADRRGIEGPSSEWKIPGATTYAPPEQHYGSFGGEWEERRATDMYLAGSLGVQLFLGHCMSALVQHFVEEKFKARNWQGSFHEVVPYLQASHATVIGHLLAAVEAATGEEEMAGEFTAAIAQTTDPDPANRGHPKDKASRTSSFAVRRYVSLMNKLSSQARLRMREK